MNTFSKEVAFVQAGIPPGCVWKVCGSLVWALPYRGALKASLHTQDPASIPAMTSCWSLSANSQQGRKLRAGGTQGARRRTKAV